MLNEKTLHALAERALALSTADETEVLLLGQATHLTRFANNYVHQNVAETNVELRVRAALGSKVGVAVTNDTTPAGLAAVVERAVTLARLQAPDPYFTGLPDPEDVVACSGRSPTEPGGTVRRPAPAVSCSGRSPTEPGGTVRRPAPAGDVACSGRSPTEPGGTVSPKRRALGRPAPAVSCSGRSPTEPGGTVSPKRRALGRPAPAGDVACSGRSLTEPGGTVSCSGRSPTEPGGRRPAPAGVSGLGYAAATAAFSAEDRARAVGAICIAAEAAGLVAAGAFSTGEEAVAVANSHGLWRYHLGTAAKLSTVVMGESGSGWASAASTDVGEILPAALAAQAVDIARRAQDPTDLPPGEYPVVLAPDAVADMLDFLGHVSFNGLAVFEGRSFVTSRLGQQVMAPTVSIWDDGLDPTGLPMPFDFEGVAKQRVPLIEAGVARGAVWDRRSAAKAGAGHASTGHAQPAPDSHGPLPTHLFMAPGGADQAALLRGIARGVWVTRFWYTRVVHPLEVVMTGMTRDGTFLIENGEITRPVHNLRFTQSYLAALAAVEAIGRETRLVDSDFGVARVPAVRVACFNFTGATQE